MAIHFDIGRKPAELRFDIRGKPALAFAVDQTRIIFSGSAPYEGDYIVIPKADAATVLPTKDKPMQDDVTVQKIPYYETANPTGDTVYIASEV